MLQKRNENFTWKLSEPLPGIEAHTERKLDVIDQYLDVYFSTLAVYPGQEELNITIVDGFCGGGIYQKQTETVFGSPMVLLGAVERAKIRLNEGRRKPLRINAVFYFSDSDKRHIEFLEQQLKKSPFRDLIGNSIHVQLGKFETLLPSILQDIKRRQTKGRSIFVLDQWGYKDVSISSLKSIFSTLTSPEVILTISVDAILNYLREDDKRVFG